MPYNQTIVGTGNTSKSVAQSSSAQNSSSSASKNITQPSSQNATTAAASMNKTSQGSSNATQGAGAVLNQTGKALSNAGNNVMQGVKNLLGGGNSGGCNSGQK